MQKKKSYTTLIVLAIVFVVADLALAGYYIYTKKKRNEAIRQYQIELAEQQRADSIAAVERAEARRDSIRRAEDIKSRMVTFSTFYTAATATKAEYIDDEVREKSVKVFVPVSDAGTTLEMQGYTQLSSRMITYDSEEGLVRNTEKVYGLNCDWDAAAQRPTDMTEPWNCIVITPEECGNRITIFFDTVESREKFLTAARTAGMKLSNGSYTGYLGYRYEGRVYFDTGDYCDNIVSITPGMNNSIIIR